MKCVQEVSLEHRPQTPSDIHPNFPSKILPGIRKEIHSEISSDIPSRMPPEISPRILKGSFQWVYFDIPRRITLKKFSWLFRKF